MLSVYVVRNMNIAFSIAALGVALFDGYGAVFRGGVERSSAGFEISAEQPETVPPTVREVMLAAAENREPEISERLIVADRGNREQSVIPEVTGSIRTQPLRLDSEIDRTVHMEQAALEVSEWMRLEREKIYQKAKLSSSALDLEANFRDEVEIYKNIYNERQAEVGRLRGLGSRICREQVGRNLENVDLRFARISLLKEERMKIYRKFHAEKFADVIEGSFSRSASMWQAMALDKNTEILRSASLKNVFCGRASEEIRGVGSIPEEKEMGISFKEAVIGIVFPLICAFVGLFNSFVSHILIQKTGIGKGGS